MLHLRFVRQIVRTNAFCQKLRSGMSQCANTLKPSETEKARRPGSGKKMQPLGFRKGFDKVEDKYWLNMQGFRVFTSVQNIRFKYISYLYFTTTTSLKFSINRSIKTYLWWSILCKVCKKNCNMCSFGQSGSLHAFTWQVSLASLTPCVTSAPWLLGVDKEPGRTQERP